ncbi:hypothetical protein Tco_1446032, partial [Tanacetum coccineum]
EDLFVLQTSSRSSRQNSVVFDEEIVHDYLESPKEKEEEVGDISIGGAGRKTMFRQFGAKMVWCLNYCFGDTGVKICQSYVYLNTYQPPSRTDWDILFQPLFDELLNPPSSVDHPAPEVITLIAEVVALEPAASTGSPSSTTVDQDAPSPSNSQTTPETQSPVIYNDVEEENHDLDVAHMNNDPFFGIPILENDSEVSSSLDVIPTIVHTVAPNSEHVIKWTKDHPLDNIIGELKRPVSTRLQLHKQALVCYYDAFLTLVESKNYKDALTQACLI